MPEEICMTFERLKSRWRALFHKDELEPELEAELRFHLDQRPKTNSHAHNLFRNRRLRVEKVEDGNHPARGHS